MKIGILREEKIPQDNRVPLTPSQCRTLMEEQSNVWIAVQPSEHRCFTNEEYRYQGIAIREDLSDCDILLGVKEIPEQTLLPNKTYLFFSHTIKKQPRNKRMLQSILAKNITLIDYECLKDRNGKRIIAFGRWAGIVGAYNGIRTFGLGIGENKFEIKPMYQCHNFAEAQKEFKKVKLPAIKIVLTGDGRVSEGADFLLEIMQIKKVSPHDFLYKEYEEAVYTQLASKDMFYYEKHDEFDSKHYHLNPTLYQSSFFPYTRVADVFINGIYWDSRIPKFFTAAQMKEKDFKIKVIADITCDIAPEASVPSTLRASTIDDPIFGYDPISENECSPFSPDSITVMAIDNLPNELPRDASEDFGNMLLSRVLPKLISGLDSETINGATITKNGKLTEAFDYLSDYVAD